MKIRRLTLYGFGTFNTGRELTFSEDQVNVVTGGNEAGKTTLVSAIYGTIFGFARAEDERRYRPWGDCERYGGEVEIAVGGKTLRISRDFDTNECTVGEVEDGLDRELFSGEANPRGRVDQGYSNTLEERLGISSGNVVANTSIIQQLDMRAEIDDELKRLVSGARGGGFQRVLAALHEQYAEVTRQNPWGSRDRQNDRAIEVAESRLGELKIRRDELAAHLQHLTALDLKIEELRAKSEDLVKARRNDERLLENLNRVTDAQQRVIASQEQLTAIRQAKEKMEAAKKRLGEIEQLMSTDFHGFSELSDDFAQQLRSLGEARASLVSAEKQAAEHKARSEALAEQVAALSRRIGAEFGDLEGLSLEFPQQLATYHERQQRLCDVQSKADAIRERLTSAKKGVEKGAGRFDPGDEGLPDRVRSLQSAQQRLAELRAKQKSEADCRHADEDERQAIQVQLDLDFPAFSGATADSRRLLIELNESRVERARLEQDCGAAEALSERAEKRCRKTRFMYIGAVLAGALTGIAIALLMAKGPVVSTVLSLLLGAAGWVVVWHAFGTVKQDAQDASERTEALHRGIEEAETRVGALSGELGPLAEFEDVQQQLARLDDHDELVRRLDELDERIAGYAEERAVQEEVDAAETKVRELVESLAPALGDRGDAAQSDDDLAKIIDEFEAFLSSHREAKACRETLDAVLERDPLAPDGGDVVGRLTAELDELRACLVGFEERSDTDEVVSRFRECQVLREKRKERQSMLDGMAEEPDPGEAVGSALQRAHECETAIGPIAERGGDLDELGGKYRRFQELRQELAVNKAILADSPDEARLSSDESVAFAEHGAAKQTIEALVIQAPYLRGLLDHPLAMAREAEKARTRLEELEREDRDLADGLRQVEIERRARQAQGGGDLEGQDSEREQLEMQLGHLREREAALRLAVDTLSEVVKEYQTQHTVRIGQAASEILSIVTDGRHPEVALDDDFVPMLPRRDGEPITEDALSCGTHDQLYLSLRVAVARELAERVALPFIMDDPFVHFDDHRVEMARRVLEAIRGSHQIIVFTHDRRCTSWADANVIWL